MLYLKSPVSKAMSESRAASSGGDMTPYEDMAVMRYGAAWAAVAHSEGKGAPSQVLEVGAISRSMEAAESLGARVARENEGWGIGVEMVRVAMASKAAVMI
jgi:hypothetical protein